MSGANASPTGRSESTMTGCFTRPELRALLREFLNRPQGRFTKTQWERFLKQKAAARERATSKKSELESIES